MPMVHVLMEQIGELPPQDFLATAQYKAQVEHMKRKQQASSAGIPIKQGKVRRRKDGD